MASFLDRLAATDAKPANVPNTSDRVMNIRQKAIDGIEIQIAQVLAAIEGKPFERPSVMKYQDMPDGTRVKQAVQNKRISCWWGKSGDNFLTVIKYGTQSIPNSKGLTSYVAGKTLEELKTFYVQLISAVSEGGLDEDLLKMSELRGAMRRKKGEPEAPVEPEAEVAPIPKTISRKRA